jgi:death-on-curing protein
MMGMPVLTDAIEMAAAYLFYISQNHPFIDANKRTALATCLVFLSENDLLENERLRIDAWEDLTLEVSSGAIDRVEATTRIRKLIK